MFICVHLWFHFSPYHPLKLESWVFEIQNEPDAQAGNPQVIYHFPALFVRYFLDGFGIHDDLTEGDQVGDGKIPRDVSCNARQSASVARTGYPAGQIPQPGRSRSIFSYNPCPSSFSTSNAQPMIRCVSSFSRKRVDSPAARSGICCVFIGVHPWFYFAADKQKRLDWAVRGGGVHGVSMDAKSSSCSCERTCPQCKENTRLLQTDIRRWKLGLNSWHSRHSRIPFGAPA